MGFGKKIINFINSDEDNDGYLELDSKTAEAVSDYEQPQNSRVSNIAKDSQMILFEPRSFEEAANVGSFLKRNKSAVVNLHKLPREHVIRFIDFLGGVIFAIDGEILKIGHNVFLCTPKSVSVSGSIDLQTEEN